MTKYDLRQGTGVPAARYEQSTENGASDEESALRSFGSKPQNSQRRVLAAGGPWRARTTRHGHSAHGGRVDSARRLVVVTPGGQGEVLCSPAPKHLVDGSFVRILFSQRSHPPLRSASCNVSPASRSGSRLPCR